MKWPENMPKWIAEALTHVGMKEIPGKSHNPKILGWLKALKAWWSEDETPWCGTYVAHCLRVVGLPIPKNWFRAKEYLTYGSFVKKDPASIPFGAIGVKTRVGGGHVFFIVARSADNRTIYALGGNQSNMVNIVPIPVAEVEGVRWPSGQPMSSIIPVTTKAEIGAVNAGSEA